MVAGVALSAVLVTSLQLPMLLSGVVGLYHDDAIYLVTAKALAEGVGYVIESVPDGLVQTKYPLVFPALLAVVWSIFPDFPSNLLALRLVPLLATYAWCWFVWFAVARSATREVAWWATALVAVSPFTLYFSTQLLSETLFAAIGSLTIFLLMRADETDAPPSLAQAAILAGCCVLAYHTRTIGVTLLVPALALFLRKRSTGPALLFFALWLIPAVAWHFWKVGHPAPSDPVLAYYTHANYSGWHVLQPGATESLINVGLSNAIFASVSPLAFWRIPFVNVWLLAAVSLAAGLTVFTGLRGKLIYPALWVIATVGVTLLWSWPPQRFLLPVLPFLLVFPLRLALAAPAPAFRAAARLVAMCLILSGLAASAGNASRGFAGYPWFDRHEAMPEADWLAAMEWLRTNTDHDAVISGNLDPAYYLYSGRHAVRAFAANPWLLHYAGSASIEALGTPPDLEALLARHRVDYLVMEHLNWFSEVPALEAQLAALLAANPSVLQLAHASPNEAVRIYRFNAPASRSPAP